MKCVINSQVVLSQPLVGPLAGYIKVLDICDTEEQLILCNTFSKNWAMTGWRMGWVQAPKILAPVLERFVQYNTSGSPVFLQRGCVAALDDGEEFVEAQITTARRARDKVVAALSRHSNIHFQVPDGAFYLFFKIDGMTDSLTTARRLVDEANIGFAPGAVFGAAGEGFMRMCYLKDDANLDEGLARFEKWLVTSKPN